MVQSSPVAEDGVECARPLGAAIGSLGENRTPRNPSAPRWQIVEHIPVSQPVWNSESALDEVRKRRALIDRCDAYLLQEIAPYIGKRVLDVGCGHGNLVAQLLDRELIVAIDIDPSSITEVHARFGDRPNVIALVCDITDSRHCMLRQYQCDTVICLNTLEHIEDDGAALANMAEVVAPGGHVIIIVPAFQFLYGSMDAAIGHYRRYSQSELQRKLESVGLQVEKQYYLNALGILGWLVNGKILRRPVPPSSQLRLFNIVFPLVSRIEAILPRIVGLSLVSISRRGC